MTFLAGARENASYSLEKALPDGDSRLRILEFLLRYGAIVNLKGRFGMTPLKETISCDKPKLPIIGLLLKYGAEITQNIVPQASVKPNFETYLNFSYHESLREKARTSHDIYHY